MSEHYSKEKLELFRNDQMSTRDHQTCETHIKECPECAKLLEELSEDDEFIRQLRTSVQAFESIEDDDFEK